MARISKDLSDRARLGSRMNLIVKVRGDLDDAAGKCEKLGFSVRRKLKILDSLAVSGSGTKIETLARQEWVMSVEEDKQVKAS